MKSIVNKLPQYDYLYLGDNARSPYGNRSFETVYRYTLECVEWFFQQGCSLVILACNTASAKALRTIQQNDLPRLGTGKRVLGVIRPTTEVIGTISKTGHIGVMATSGTVQSGSYLIEIEKFFPGLQVVQEACPMWVPLIENNEHLNEGADYFVRKHINQLLAQDRNIDAILLACTHYPLLQQKIKSLVPENVAIVSQGDIVADSLAEYLQRHPEMDQACSRGESKTFFTTDSTLDFDNHATVFFGEKISSKHLDLSSKK